MPVPLKPFYMIRHGQTEANAGEYMAGSLDSPLTELGIRQAEAARLAVEALEEPPTIIIHSNLSRARDTAAIINQNLKLDMIEDPDYAEMHVGEMEGKPWTECEAIFHHGLNPPGGETHQQFIDRVTRAKNRTLKLQKIPALVVCHGGVFKAFAQLYNIDIWGVENCKLHRFTPSSPDGSFPWIAHSLYHDEKLITELSNAFHHEDEI